MLLNMEQVDNPGGGDGAQAQRERRRAAFETADRLLREMRGMTARAGAESALEMHFSTRQEAAWAARGKLVP